MGLLDKLFGTGKNVRPKPSTMTAAMAEKIVRDYGAVLRSGAPTLGVVADVQELPHPKERIKEALVFALRSTADPKIREALTLGYIDLADWQEGVGNTRAGIDLTKMDPNEDPMKLAERIVAQSAGADKWIAVVEAERQALESELRRLNLW